MSVPTGHISASEYGRRLGVGKSGVSRWLRAGMPHVEGTDDHGRFCKFVDPAKADAWRTTNLTNKIDGASGKLRGAVTQSSRSSPRTRSKAPPTPAAKEAPPPAFPPAGGGNPDNPREEGSTAGGGDTAAARKPAPEPKAARPAAIVEDDGLDAAAQMALRTQQMRLQKEEDISATVRLRRLAAEGKLIDREAAVEEHEAFVGSVGRLLDRMPADNATTLANDLGCTEHEAYVSLKRLGDKLRSDLAVSAAHRRDRTAGEVELPEPDYGVEGPQ